jgi:hypothetical protein
LVLDWLAARQRDASLNFARGFGVADIDAAVADIDAAVADIDAAVAEAIELGLYQAGTDPSNRHGRWQHAPTSRRRCAGWWPGTSQTAAS